MIKEEIMDIDEEEMVPGSVVIKEEPMLPAKSNNFKYKLLERLETSDSTNLTKNLTLAITIQTMFNKDAEVLERLFRFFIDQKQIDMAIDLWETDILRKFNLSTVTEFDAHLTRISTQIIFHLSVKALSEREKNQLAKLEIDPIDEFYLELFLKLSQPSQEKLITQLLDKYRAGFSFLKINPAEQATSVKKELPTSQQTIDIREFYTKLIEVKETIFITKNLLTIYKKFIPEYGLFLIDGFLNIEKQLFANLIQNSSQTDQILSNIEKRSLNVIRRICVVDLIPEFIYLIDKLDNRHCYRWIEKSLEFFTKYTLNSIEAKMETIPPGRGFVKIGYVNVRLLNDIELYSVSEDKKVFNERIEFLNQNLTDLVDYKYVADANNTDNSPFQHVYQLLDEIGKKLDWPAMPNNLQNSSLSDSDNKLSYLLTLKAKALETKPTNVSVSSLNKQISFYGIALFFQKLIEFNSLAKAFFNDNLLMTRKFDLVVKKTFMDTLEPASLSGSQQWFEPIDLAISTLVYVLKLWQKFNSHKEFSTIVTKCLSNSKLDSLTFYKNFLKEYYSVYSSTLNAVNSPAVTWESYQALTTLKEKILALVNLFINEMSSFDKFFSEFHAILSQLKLEGNERKHTSTGEIILANNQFEIFELNLNNTLDYVSRLIIEKLYQQLVQKNTNIIKYLSESDTAMGHLIVLVQINLLENAPNYIVEFYDIVFQVVKAKGSFNYPEFFCYIYDIQILQDFLSLINATNTTESKNLNWKLDPKLKADDIELLKSKFYDQVNSEMSDNRHILLDSFYKKHGESLADHFNMMFKN